MNYLSFDVGTTCCKCQLFSEKGEILEYLSEEYDFRREGEYSYVDIDAVWKHLKGMLKEVASRHEVSSVCISSFGESFVLLDEDDNVIFYPMIYTDPRGEHEADAVLERFGGEYLFNVTGVLPQSMYSLYKLLWIKNNRPEIFKKGAKVALNCDYLGFLLTGKRVIDYGLAARTGVFDIAEKRFSDEILGEYGLSSSMFSSPAPTGSVVGKIRQELKEELSLKGDCTLVLGSHDQVCAALGAGVLKEGDAVDGMGTVECITTVFSKKPTDVNMGHQGYCCVPYAVDGLYCTYILNYSCGSTVNWLRKGIMHGYKGEEKDFFTYIEKGMKDGPTGILMLPYLGGASTPFQNVNAKGCFLNLTTDTTDSDIYKAVMEGTAMEMRLNSEVSSAYGVNIKSLVATGGGANSEKWLKLKASIQNVPVKTLRSSEGGLCGCAIMQAVAMGQFATLEEAAGTFIVYGNEYTPENAVYRAYEGQYKKYKKLYQTVKEMY
ncbi:MAG: hypothetical protein IJV67_04280 [Clostridia bacterium]|nr:hypothetical protein [Clostridia bacterium]